MNSNRLQNLERKISLCRICIDHPQETKLGHEPRPVVQMSDTAKICIAGQAPGMRVHKTGIPFNDPSGNRLRNWLGINKSTFYDKSRIAIVPMGLCFPGYDKNGGDLPPRKECRAAWHDRIFALMPQIELIIVIGQYAQAYHLKNWRFNTVTETVQQGREIYLNAYTPKYLPLPHPSWRNNGWLKKNPWFERQFLPKLKIDINKILRNEGGNF